MRDRPQLSDIETAEDNLPASQRVDHQSQTETRLRRDLARISEEKEEIRLELQEVRLKLQTKEFIQSLAKPYASKVYWFMATYCTVAGIMLFLDGFNFSFAIGAKDFTFDLETSILQVLVGSTAVSVIGLVGLVVKGVFDGIGKSN